MCKIVCSVRAEYTGHASCLIHHGIPIVGLEIDRYKYIVMESERETYLWKMVDESCWYNDV